ncbi:ES1 protein homolog, mitochondrial-like [Macrosteles quadrilineatus]|uniref:ES1 protein homolog, mitochondrial-like n=1 Tax=Macrosteles quadrilineatus TaxID=74068 RepID=UPI0023E294CA|nr:ES1 protein homolog, mitochondrial-like [Macrosteles quadrilineatus]XP_054287565.1 ES1 protein homolog, mitochondrial-like [Macrosteles quadrilineatus]
MLKTLIKFGLIKHQHAAVATAYYSSKSCPSIAVVLAGCGVNDGTEVHEASAVLSHITRNKAVPHMFAPDVPQFDVINHLECKQDTTHCRNVLVESARIARGQILPLSELAKNSQKYDAVVFPGGFGAAKNLSDFATKGPDCTVIPDVETVIQEFHRCRKPIGLTCIAPILAARVICGVAITLGQNSCDGEKWPYRDAIKAAEQMQAVVENKDVNETTFDRKNLVFSTPAYMYGVAQFHEVDDGIGGMIKYMILSIKDGK